MVINTNGNALSAAAMLADASAGLIRSLARLSSGSKIVTAADDSAGLAVSMRLGAQLARLNAAGSNVANAISFSQTQDGYLEKVSDALTRMSALAVLAMDATKSSVDRMNCDIECQALGNSLGQTAAAKFNNVPLFDGQSLDVTIDSDANKFTMQGISPNAFTLFTLDNLQYISSSKITLKFVKSALDQVAGYRAQIGSNLESLSYYGDQLATLKNNLSSANSRITDVDVAQESTNYAKYNIRVQSGTAMLAQANVQPQSVLKLLG
jgi:flagellin